MTPIPSACRSGGLAWRALPIVVVAAVACGSSGASTATSTSTAVPPTSVTTTTVGAETSGPSTTSASPVPQLDPVATVLDGLVGAGTSYRFISTVTVGDETTTTITGRVVGADFASTILTGDTEVDYVKTAEGEWLRGPDEQWVVLDQPAPAGDPLAALSEPLSAEVIRIDGPVREIEAIYAGAALGLEIAELAVLIVVDDGRVRTISYQVAIGNTLTGVETELSDYGSVEPIEAPEV